MRDTDIQYISKGAGKAGQKPVSSIDNDVLYIDSITHIDASQLFRTNYNAVVLCLEGSISVELGGNRQVDVEKGELLLVPEQKIVKPLMISEDMKASLLLLTNKALKSALGSQVGIWNKALYTKDIFVVKNAAWVTYIQKIKDMQDMLKKNDALFKEISLSFLRTFLLLICQCLLTCKDMTTDDYTSTPSENVIFDKFITLLSSQPTKHSKVESFAERMNITPKYLSIVCKRVSGKSPVKWIHEYVMEGCYSLLIGTNLSIKQISDELGFPNSSFFGQFFKANAGLTPGEYRSKNRIITVEKND